MKLPDRAILVAPTVPIKQLADAEGRSGLQQPAEGDEASKAPRRICSPAEPEDEDVITRLVGLHKPLVGWGDISIDAHAEKAATNLLAKGRADASAIISNLLQTICTTIGAQRS